jgi:hypothetical protein
LVSVCGLQLTPFGWLVSAGRLLEAPDGRREIGKKRLRHDVRDEPRFDESRDRFDEKV